MARKAVAVTVLIYCVGLVSLVCGMPPTQTGSMSPPRDRLPLHGGRVQCPACLNFFKLETGLRHHCGALGRLGLITTQTGCAVDTRQSVISDWTGEGRGAADTARNLATQSVHLPGMTDSDSDGNRRDGHPGHHAPDMTIMAVNDWLHWYHLFRHPEPDDDDIDQLTNMGKAHYFRSKSAVVTKGPLAFDPCGAMRRFTPSYMPQGHSVAWVEARTFHVR